MATTKQECHFLKSNIQRTKKKKELYEINDSENEKLN